MAKEIKWTKTAAKNFAKTVNYLEEEWSETVVSNFIHRVHEILFILSEFPQIGEIQDRQKDIRAVLLTRHNKLFYRIDGTRLIVLRIFDTRQNPKKLKFR